MEPQVPAIPNPLALFPAASVETVLAVVITAAFIWWAIFTLVAGYHLFKYARESWLTVPAFALHIFVSGWIFVFATGALH